MPISPDGTGVPDVPDLSARAYRAVVETVARWPDAVQRLLEPAGDLALLLVLALAGVLWWRARTRSATAAARVLAVPLTATGAYLASELIKSVWRVDRPCRVVSWPADVVAAAPCPELGDWSFPSNHATIAGAVAVGALWCAARIGLLAVLLALLAAAARVLAGVHYPHDVIVGLVLGATAALAVPIIAAMTGRAVLRVRTRRAGRLLLGAGPPVAAHRVSDR